MTDAAVFRIDGVALAVRDLGRVLAFYRDVVGLEVVREGGGEAALGAGGAAFLRLQEDRALRPRDPATAGLFHVAYLLPARDDLGRWLNHAAATGVALDGAADHLVSEAVYLHDPEGNGVEIYRDRARAEWVWEGGEVAMANDRLDLAGLRQAGGRWAGAPGGTRIGHVHLQVGDAGEAARFYTEALGLAVARRVAQAVFMGHGGYHHHLAANTWRSAGAGRRMPGAAGLAAVTLGAGTAAGPVSTIEDPWGTVLHVVSPD